MKRLLLGLAILTVILPVSFAQDYDDIYYNPKSNGSSSDSKSKSKSTSKSNYISDFENIDVDLYNKRGFYYETEIDTIGNNAENTEDFVYTQQIQKYYNPTIVVDNADILADILENSYGNVDINIDNGYPVFNSIYTGSYYWGPGIYYNWNYSPTWNWYYAWNPVYLSWTWGPSWWWGPAWAYGPSWTWGPSWGWGPSWYPVNRPYYSYNAPGAFRPVSPNPGWSNNHRPGSSVTRPISRPGNPGYISNNGIKRPGASQKLEHNRPIVNPNNGGTRPSGNIINGHTFSGNRPGSNANVPSISRPVTPGRPGNSQINSGTPSVNNKRGSVQTPSNINNSPINNNRPSGYTNRSTNSGSQTIRSNNNGMKSSTGSMRSGSSGPMRSSSGGSGGVRGGRR